LLSCILSIDIDHTLVHTNYGEVGGGGRKRIHTKHAVVHDTIDMPQEMAISVELRDDDVHSTLWETDFGSSSEIIVLQNAIWLVSEQRASAGGEGGREGK
jgi:hypothetical protein